MEKLDTKNRIWTTITVISVALIIAVTAVFISFQYNQTQKDIANINAQAQKDSAKQMSDGLGNIGVGICQARANDSFRICSN